MLPNAIDVFSGDSLAALILVQNTENVEIEGLIVDGTNNGITDCSPDLIGILYQNASGHIHHNAVRHLKLAGTLSGCQSGNGIIAQSGSGGSATVQITENSIKDYQKNGISGNETGTKVTINKNVVTGTGPTTGAAQNGIQVGFGAQGRVTNNSLADNVWAPCISVSDCTANGTGILIFQSNGVDVEGNSVGTNQVGIAVEGQNTRIGSNTAFNSLVLSSVAVIGDDNRVTDNQITHSSNTSILADIVSSLAVLSPAEGQPNNLVCACESWVYKCGVPASKSKPNPGSGQIRDQGSSLCQVFFNKSVTAGKVCRH
jgi:hypothetical protein